MSLTGQTLDGKASEMGNQDKNHFSDRDIEDGSPLAGEPIAIVGIGCRLPGDNSSPSKLWEFLSAGKSGHCNVPKSRYDADAYYHPNPDRPGSINSNGGYFVQNDIKEFDNAFFGINNLEAMYMDPQQRQLLEVIWESYESAGITLEQVHGSNTGCYVGNFTLDHAIHQYHDDAYVSRFTAAGSAPTILANRVSHVLDLKGPSMVVDTACSSSIYSLHLASSALRHNECDTTIVAAANLIQGPFMQQVAAKAGILSNSSVCHTFDESADGYGRSEGVVSVILKRLSDAVREELPVRAVLRGTAVNSNGRTNGITLPSSDGQEKVIRKAYSLAGLSPDQTDYVEAHGTGTAVGDPIETEAISRVFKHRSGRPTMVGSVKTNLGHSEAASALSSIVKVTLAMENGSIPPTIGLKTLNPKIKVDEWNLKVLTEAARWPDEAMKRASINSFGFGGANGHAILESASMHVPAGYVSTTAAASQTPSSALSLNLLGISAQSQNSLEQYAAALSSCSLIAQGHVGVGELALTMSNKRSSFPQKACFIVDPSSCLSDSLQFESAMTLGDESPSSYPFAFVFTGQGAQWPRMGAELFQYQRFADTFDHLDSCLSSLGSYAPEWSLKDILLASEENSLIQEVSKSQPICTAVQIGLIDLLREWGVFPSVVVGHSSGEMAAAYASNRITAYQAIIAAYFRGYAVAESDLSGAMMAAGVSADAANQMISELDLEALCIRVACINSPESVTLSGDVAPIDTVYSALKAKGLLASKLRTGGKAYHSTHMLAVGQRYQDLVEEFWNKDSASSHSYCGKPNAEMISSVRNKWLDTKDSLGPAYWRANLENPVLFEPAVEQILRKQSYRFLELGPHNGMKLPVKQTATAKVPNAVYEYSSTLVRGKNGMQTMMDLAASLFLNEYNLDISKINGMGSVEQARLRWINQQLPSYAWDHETELWIEPRAVTEIKNRKYPRHDLLGSKVPGLTTNTTTWRNIVDWDEVAWIKDHRLGPTTVFPAAGYIAMAVEATNQVHGVPTASASPGVELKDWNFLKALTFSEQQPKREVFVEMKPLQLTAAVASARWWTFEVSSVSSSTTTKHVSGLVSLMESGVKVDSSISGEGIALEQSAVRTWYNKFRAEGLNWGPRFAAMKELYCDRQRKEQYAKAKISPLQGQDEEPTGGMKYAVHPIAIDSMLQAAFVATTSGRVDGLQAKMPVTMQYAKVGSPGPIDRQPEDLWTIETSTLTRGFGTSHVGADLYDKNGRILAQLGGVRCIAFEGRAKGASSESKRTPIARLAWKPNYKYLVPSIEENLAGFFESIQRDLGLEEDEAAFVGSLDMVAHDDPNLRILELALPNSAHTSDHFIRILNGRSDMRRCRSYTKGICFNDSVSLHDATKDVDGEIVFKEEARDQDPNLFDVVIVPAPLFKAFFDALSRKDFTLSDSAVVLYGRSEAAVALATVSDARKRKVRKALNRAGMAMVRKFDAEDLAERKLTTVYLVHQSTQQPLLPALIVQIETDLACKVQAIPLDTITPDAIPKQGIVLSTIEFDSFVLESLPDTTMRKLKNITDAASVLLWLTPTDLMTGANPAANLSYGLARALALEQPSLRMAIYGIDNIDKSLNLTASHVSNVLKSLVNDPASDLEFMQKDGIIHTCRFVPDDHLNSSFRAKQNGEPVSVALKDAGPIELQIQNPGQFDTLCFTQNVRNSELAPTDVEVDVKSVGMNAKDLYVMGAQVDTIDAACSCEGAGVIRRVGSEVSEFSVGDRIVFMGTGHFGSVAKLPEWSCCKLRADEDFTTMSTVNLVFSTAIYALQNRAQAQEGESVLIHSGAGGLGIAAIQIAKLLGLEIFTTVGTGEKAKFLSEQFSIPRDHVFHSRSTKFVEDLLAITENRGVDIVLNSLSGELLHASASVLAPFGRFIEIGKRDIIDKGRLDMSMFADSATFSAFDLSHLFTSQRPANNKTWRKLMNQTMEMVRSGQVKPVQPIKVFPAAEIITAFRHFSQGSRLGKVAISFEDQEQIIQVLPKKHASSFSPDKSYLLVGCLGGLGRSISKWMLSRGARHFTFLGRSGTDKPEAKSLVDDLIAQGADVTVVRGDVTDFTAVQEAVAACTLPIGGVYQAAMYLSEAIWTVMPNASWQKCIDVKVKGTWNVHNALRGHDSALDFFFMTSSIAGAIGTATEANYCAANAFLDAFARWRNSQGLPATSIALGMISEVGYLHEHPEIESLLHRKGVNPISEDEMIQIMDLALQNPASTSSQYGSCRYDTLASAHIVTGLEFLSLEEQRRAGFEGESHVLSDRRANVYAASFQRATDGLDSFDASATRGLPPELAEALKSGATSSVLDAVSGMVRMKVANLILHDPEKLKPDTKFAQFGLDSMLAAEFRGFVFRSLEVDIPFMALLDADMTVNGMAKMICEELEKKKEEEVKA